MAEFLSKPEIFFWLAIASMVCVPVVAQYWRQMRRDELDASLKQDMIARGMSAVEIERVLAAGRKKKDE